MPDPPEDDEPPEAVEIPITGELDLHPFSPRDVVAVASDYLDACRERGILTVRLVHGRGKGVQRAAVRRMLAGRGDVASFADADPIGGGWGATMVALRPPAPRAPAP